MARFMTDPHAMRAMAGRFEMHAQTVSDEARKMWSSSQNIAGASWSGPAQATSYDTMGQMNQAFNNIVNMLPSDPHSNFMVITHRSQRKPPFVLPWMI